MDLSTLTQISRELDNRACNDPIDRTWAKGGIVSASQDDLLCWLHHVAPSIVEHLKHVDQAILMQELKKFAIARIVTCYADHETRQKPLKHIKDTSDLKFDQLLPCTGLDKTQFKSMDSEIRKMQNAEIDDFKTDVLGIENTHCCCSAMATMFRKECDGTRIDYNVPTSLNNYQRVSAWIMHYFTARMPLGLSTLYNSFHTHPRFRREHQCAFVNDHYIVPGDIITTHIVLDVDHVGIIVGSFQHTVFIADLTVTGNCAEVAIRTLENFRRGHSVHIRMSAPNQRRKSLVHSFQCISGIIGRRLQYNVLSTNCDSFINTICFGAQAVGQLPFEKLRHKTMFTIDPSDTIQVSRLNIGPMDQEMFD